MTSPITEKTHGVNAIRVADEPFLLAGGDASHLVAEDQDMTGKSACDGQLILARHSLFGAVR
jgi:hypothetical protein